MGKVAGFLELAARESRADFAIVYIEEAHPTDGWLYPAVEHFIPQPTQLSERLAAARVLDGEIARAGRAREVPLVVDGMENRASAAFGALPERLVIVRDGHVLFIGGPGPEEYDLGEAEAALKRCLE